MAFNPFGKKKQPTLTEEIKGHVVYQRAASLLEKAKDLRKLGRGDEADSLLRDAEKLVKDNAKLSPRSLQAQLLVAIFYEEVHSYDRAEAVLSRLLTSGQFEISTENRMIFEGAILKMRRQRPSADKREEETPKSYTQIYGCQNCGRLINYVTMPCSHCGWYPADISGLARSIVLSNVYLSVPALLLMARQMSNNGLSPSQIVLNLEKNAQQYVAMPEAQSRLRYLFELLQKDARKHYRSLPQLKSCPNCGEHMMASQQENCGACGNAVNWPDVLKLLVSMDNLLWLFENRVELADCSELSELVCLLVVMTHNLLHKQETPSTDQRRYSLSLLKQIKSIPDANGGAIVDLTNPEKMTIYLGAALL